MNVWKKEEVYKITSYEYLQERIKHNLRKR